MRILLTLLLIACLQSCIYDTNYMSEVDIEKPNTFQQLDISLSSAKDSMILFGPIDLNFDVNTYNLKFNAAVLKYLDVEQTFEQPSGSFTLIPDIRNENWFDLTIDFYAFTGSGSIADRLNVENYLGSKTWKVKFFNLKTFDYHFQNHINADSIVEVFWVKPGVAPSTIGAVYGSTGKLTVTKISGDTLFYADSAYCGGPLNYNLNVSVNSEEQIGFDTHVDYPYPGFTFTPIGLDSCLVSWTTSPVKRYSKLLDKYAGFGNSFKDVVLPGVSMNYNLFTYPVNYTAASSYSAYIWTTYVKGIKADYNWAYSNVKDKFVLSKAITNYPGLVWSDYTLPPYDRKVEGFGMEYIIVGNNAGTHFGGILYGVLHVFDENLTEIRQITLGTRPETDSYYYLQVTDNGCFTCLNDNREFTIYNIGTDPGWQKFTFKPNYIDSTAISYAMGMTSLTADGHYAAVCAERNLYIYDVSDHQHANVVFSVPRAQAYNVLANRLNKEELIVTSKDKIEVRTCPGFQLKKQLVLTGMGNFNIMNVDSYSNILLVSSSTYYHFISLESMQEVFRLTLGGNPYYGYGGRLYRKQFFMGSTKTDMTPYLK